MSERWFTDLVKFLMFFQLIVVIFSFWLGWELEKGTVGTSVILFIMSIIWILIDGYGEKKRSD